MDEKWQLFIRGLFELPAEICQWEVEVTLYTGQVIKGVLENKFNLNAVFICDGTTNFIIPYAAIRHISCPANPNPAETAAEA